MSTFLFITRTNERMQSKVVRHAIISNHYRKQLHSRSLTIASLMHSFDAFFSPIFFVPRKRVRGWIPRTSAWSITFDHGGGGAASGAQFAPRVGTLRWKRSSKTGPQLTISPWDRASAKRPRIKLGFPINEKTFQPENNSRIDTRSYPVHRRSYFLSKKNQASLSRVTLLVHRFLSAFIVR